MHVPQNCDRSLATAGVAFEGALTLRPSVVPGLVAKETRLRRAAWRRRGKPLSHDIHVRQPEFAINQDGSEGRHLPPPACANAEAL